MRKNASSRMNQPFCMEELKKSLNAFNQQGNNTILETNLQLRNKNWQWKVKLL
jgi:hypothetical protein